MQVLRILFAQHRDLISLYLFFINYSHTTLEINCIQFSKWGWDRVWDRRFAVNFLPFLVGLVLWMGAAEKPPFLLRIHLQATEGAKGWAATKARSLTRVPAAGSGT